MSLLTDAKVILRIINTNVAFDSEINDLIAVSKKDMEIAGIVVSDDTDALVKRAILTYIKANFGYDNPDFDQLMVSYNLLIAKLATSMAYSWYKVTITASEQGAVSFDGVEKETNEAGEVIFYSRSKNHIKYIVDGVTDYVDITADVTIGGD